MTTHTVKMSDDTREALEQSIKQGAYDALMRVLEAADNWCDYLDENDREGEVDPIEQAIDLLRNAAVRPT
jgi:hypothetical protein